jgi:hypothetical protein
MFHTAICAPEINYKCTLFEVQICKTYTGFFVKNVGSGFGKMMPIRTDSDTQH